MSALLAILFGAGLLYYVLTPLGEISAAAANSDRDARARLESALGEIMDLEADMETGKIAREDYLAARAQAEARAAQALPGKGREKKR